MEIAATSNILDVSFDPHVKEARPGYRLIDLLSDNIHFDTWRPSEFSTYEDREAHLNAITNKFSARTDVALCGTDGSILSTGLQGHASAHVVLDNQVICDDYWHSGRVLSTDAELFAI